jgi:hypothetical protein
LRKVRGFVRRSGLLQQAKAFAPSSSGAESFAQRRAVVRPAIAKGVSRWCCAFKDAQGLRSSTSGESGFSASPTAQLRVASGIIAFASSLPKPRLLVQDGFGFLRAALHRQVR